jgi:predicted acylesterase/phospholipase RssA
MSENLPEVLVIGPGGMNGFYYLGALFALNKNNILDNVHTCIGVSVGSAISLLLICGYTMSEIITEILDTKIFRDINDITLDEAITKLGITSNNSIKETLSKLVSDKIGYIPTLEQLKVLKDKTFIAVTCDIDQLDIEKKILYLSYKSDPELSCVEAVLLSSNIPVIFHKMIHRNHNCIDGAFGDPYPVLLLDDKKTNILGLFVKSIYGENKNNAKEKLNYITKIMQFSISQLQNRSMNTSSIKCKHLILNGKTYSSIGIGVTMENKADMIISAYEQTSNFIKESLN